MELKVLSEVMRERFHVRIDRLQDDELIIACPREHLIDVCAELASEQGYNFAGLFVEGGEEEWTLRYLFYAEQGFVHILTSSKMADGTFPSISAWVHGADWHERMAEDLFGLTFSGHPRLGEFVLHEQWPEGTNPMRRKFDTSRPFPNQEVDFHWEPPRVFAAPGAFSMPIGPIYSGADESVHFQLETIGEEIVRVIPRLFYKYRAVEALARGRSVDRALLLAERFSGTSSFAHALAFCRGVERICAASVPPRAERLRVFLAEIERLRHHIAAIHGICASTGLAVAASQMSILEEDALRLSAVLTGHRYLFSIAAPGGLTRDFDAAACRAAAERSEKIVRRLNDLEHMLARSSSFLDRLERVGIVAPADARRYGLVGPVARASGSGCDVRDMFPYSGYADLHVFVAREEEGDGYARLRVLFSEARESARLIGRIASDLPSGDIRTPVSVRAGAGLGWVEAPRGAAFHWLRLADDGSIVEWRIIPPSFANWHGFHLAAEGFAFQDFPIILATFGLSAAENDR